MTLRERIKELCKENNISLNKLEIECGFSKGYISKLDKSTPNTANIQKIADYFGVSTSYLMGEKEYTLSKEQAELDLKITNDLELRNAIEKYCTLDERKRKHVLELIDILSEV